jgi:hypothetical protein
MGAPFHPEREIGHGTAALTEKMGMFREIRAIARRLAMMMDMLDQSAFRERLETVINRRERNRRHPRFHAEKHFDRRRMIALRHELVVNLTALRGETKPLCGDPFIV